jgi:enterochelin esterase-like enzyme
MKKLSILFALLSTGASLAAQDYSSFSQTIKRLYSDTIQTETDAVWNELVSAGKIPLVHEDSVAFLYRGNAKSISWMGDFNGWGYNKNFYNKGTRIPDTDIWILKTSFAKDARLDYKILINDSDWVLDPNNDKHQWSGVGGGSPNSELRMSEWKSDPLTTGLVEHAKQGRVEKDLLLNSKSLAYQVTYSVYLPQGYSKTSTYPVIYVTDGYEYMHERLGNMVTILDNLIHLKKIAPVIAVFIDHREPINRSNNRRMEELAMNEKYLTFITAELLPFIESKYSVMKDAPHRGIIGTSMGGLSAAYFAFSKPDVFGLAGIQSPAFWFRPEIYTICDNPSNPPVKTFMTTGTINDTAEGAEKMKALLDKNTCNYKFEEVNQGHSWGNWRDLIDDILIYFFPVG